MLVIEAPLGCPTGETLAAGLLAVTTTVKRPLVRSPVSGPMDQGPTYILRLLHSAQACGVVILLAVPDPLVLVLSWESVDALRGVTPWKVWNMPPCVGTGMVGAMVEESEVKGIKGISGMLGTGPRSDTGS